MMMQKHTLQSESIELAGLVERLSIEEDEANFLPPPSEASNPITQGGKFPGFH